MRSMSNYVIIIRQQLKKYICSFTILKIMNIIIEFKTIDLVWKIVCLQKHAKTSSVKTPRSRHFLV